MERRLILAGLLGMVWAGCAQQGGMGDLYGIDGEASRTSQTVWQEGREVVSLRGRVRDVTRMTPGGPPFDHMLVTLALRDGREQVADLGPSDRMGDLYLEVGDELSVEGRLAQAHGRWLLLAERFEQGGRWRRANGSAGHGG